MFVFTRNLQYLLNTPDRKFMLNSFLFLLTQKNTLLFISLIWVILVILINPYGEFPYNDDWAYARSVKTLVETRTFFISGWTSVNLLVQIGWGVLFCLPFGFSFTALRISTLVAGLFGLWATYKLIYNSTENRAIAFVGTLLLLVNPMYLGLSASFMSDVPFYTLAVWSLSYMVEGLKKDATRSIVIGLTLAVITLLIRQLAIALFVGFGIAYLVRKGIHLKSVALACMSVAIGLGTQIAYQRWLPHIMPGMVSYNVQATNFFHLSFYKLRLLSDFTHNTFIGLMYTGLFLFPYFLFLLTKDSLSALRKHSWLWALSAAVILSLWYYYFDWGYMPIWFNTINAYGLGPVLMRDIYYRLYSLNFPNYLHLITIGMTIGSLLGSIGILYYSARLVYGLTRRSVSASWRSVCVLLFCVIAVYFLPIGLHVVFDRYLLPLPTLLLIPIYLLKTHFNEKKLAHPLRLPLTLSMSLFALYLLFSVCATHDFLAWNRVRWRALGHLMQQGIKPAQIDGGLEFNGWHLYKSNYKSTPDKSWWWVQDDTYIVGASVLPGYTLFGKYKVDTWFPWGIQEIIVNKKNTAAPKNSLANPYSTDG